MSGEFSREEYHSRLSWLILIRLVLAALLIGSLLIVQYQYQLFHFRAVLLYYFAGAVLALSTLYRHLLDRLENLRTLAYIQLGGDLLLISGLVGITGIIDSSFSILYHITIISGSIILYRRGGYLCASLSSILYGTLLDMQYYNVFGIARSQNFTGIQVLFLVFVNILSFYAVAFLSGYLSERLRATRRELLEKSLDFEDLRVLQEHIVKSVGSGIVTMDMGGSITSWNNAAEQITGYTFDDILRNWKSVFGESVKGLFGQTDELKTRPVRFQGQIHKRNGMLATLGFTASLLRDDKDHVRGIILTFQDITRLVEMEEQMRRQERLATVGSLAAGIAHEIRNPLAALSGSIQMLREELVLKGDNRRLMDIVIREADRLNTIITDFLDYARPKAADRERVSLASLLQETVVLFTNSREYRQNIVVQTDIEPSIYVTGDPQRLRQVVWNLLINAAQAIPESGEIRVSATRRGAAPADEVIVSVSDTGTGIGQAERDKIFDPFFTTKSHGTGLGLAIVYRIIEEHGGTITVRSAKGEGTTFLIRLPAASPVTAERQAGRKAPVQGA